MSKPGADESSRFKSFLTHTDYSSIFNFRDDSIVETQPTTWGRGGDNRLAKTSKFYVRQENWRKCIAGVSSNQL